LGSAHVDVTGGTLPYGYSWSNTYDGQTATGLVSGNYTVSVSDAHGCSDEATMYVGISGSGIVEIVQDEEITCHGESSAVLTGTMINGVGPFEYMWSNDAVTQTIEQLSAGIYSLEVSDSWGCSGSDSYLVIEPDEIELSFVSTDVTCFGYEDGSATVSVSGGTPGYTYEWITGDADAILNDVGVGTYQVLVTDTQFCQIVGSVEVSGPESPVEVTMDIINISCNGYHDGSVQISVEGGTSPYTYSWQIGDYITNDQNIANLFEGVYYLTVVDGNNCVTEEEAVISQPLVLDASYISMNPSCIGNSDGYIEIVAEGGTEPYSYAWSAGSSSLEYIDGLVEGDYLVTVVDSRGCEHELDLIHLADVQEECLKIPNAFTPNGDGVNDTWILENIQMYPMSYVQVYNRWGQALYEAKGLGEPWDGTYNGNAVPTGPYIYVVNLYNGDEPKTGTVTIVR